MVTTRALLIGWAMACLSTLAVGQTRVDEPPVEPSILHALAPTGKLRASINLGNRVQARNSIVMWLHREKADVVARWGETAIVRW